MKKKKLEIVYNWYYGTLGGPIWSFWLAKDEIKIMDGTRLYATKHGCSAAAKKLADQLGITARFLEDEAE